MNRSRRWLAVLITALALGAPLPTLPALSASASPATTQAVVGSAAAATQQVRRCHGYRATIVGGRRGTVIIGTRRRDVIYAGAGADVVLGLGGRDLICGGPGNDAIDSGKGRDRVYGGPGRGDQCIGTRFEHRRLHFGCEIHGATGTVTPPGTPPQTAPRGSSATLDASPATPVPGRRRVITGASTPDCRPGAIDPKLLFVKAQGTDPGAGNVYFATGYIPRGNNGNYYYGRAQYPYGLQHSSVPYDLAEYQIPLGRANTSGGQFWVFHLVWFWNETTKDWTLEQRDVGAYYSYLGDRPQPYTAGFCAT